MRIALLTHYYAPETGAPQRRWGALARRFAQAGHQLFVVCPRPHYPSGRIPRAERGRHRVGRVERGDQGERILRVAHLMHGQDIITRTLDHLVSSASMAYRLDRLWRHPEARPEVIVVTVPAIPTLLAAWALARRYSLPMVVEMRDAWPDLVTHTGGLSRDARLIAEVKVRVHRAITNGQRTADHVITTTEHFAQVLRGRGIRRVDVVRNGTDLAHRPLLPPVGRGQDEGARRPLNCLYLGNMGRSQGLDTLVYAAAALAKAGVPISVRLIGHGSDRQRLAQLVARTKAPVTIYDRIPPEQVMGHYLWADTVVVSLRDWEPFRWTIPSKLFEVLAVGRHITGLLDGEAAQVLRDSGAGDVLAPGDAQGLADLWRRLQSHREELDRGDVGRRWVADHADDDILARRYLEILQRVCDEHEGS
ncbi:glycosyltransferase family 4 protein [Devriesea agamarum]|uniref:glycosyltransferase family 4 protein n=1 Tax=Devriesea agamarum TaxID=472569 RepID=UPI00071CE913|nr:glycosyltransferase family 4 protein [Devriesea agamarum]